MNVKKHARRATEHRLLVMEAVATCPEQCSLETIKKDCSSADFPSHSVVVMVWQLCREGLLGRSEESYYFLTEFGLAYLYAADFTRGLPEYAPRPKARRKRKQV